MITRVGGPRLAILCDRLHRLAQLIDPVRGPERGRRFELRVERDLLDRGFPVRSVPGGVEILGTLPASGMRHQIDAEAWCRECDVIAEWKAYTTMVPKNDLLLFKAKTDDIYEGLAQHREPRRPIVRVFGMAGDATPTARAYAARHSIVLIERTRWPAPVLGDPRMVWHGDQPSGHELRALHHLARPMQEVYRRTTSGRLIAPAHLPEEIVTEILDVHDAVSERFDAAIDGDETLLAA